MSSHAGLIVVAVGVAIALVGVLIWTGALGWFGHLPGDIRIERETVRIYVPLVSMLLVSILLSLIMYAIRKLR